VIAQEGVDLKMIWLLTLPFGCLMNEIAPRAETLNKDK